MKMKKSVEILIFSLQMRHEKNTEVNLHIVCDIDQLPMKSDLQGLPCNYLMGFELQ